MTDMFLKKFPSTKRRRDEFINTGSAAVVLGFPGVLLELSTLILN